MNKYRNSLLGLGVVLWLSGCASSQNSRFYSFAENTPQITAGGNQVTLAVGPIDLPRYLDRPQLVMRSVANQVEVDEFVRWAGGLDEEIQRLLAARLMLALDTELIYAYPSRIVANTDYRVALVVRTFDGYLGGEITLDVGWALFEEDSLTTVSANQAQYRTVATSTDYDAYVSAMAELLERLAADLAEEVRKAQQSAKGHLE